MTVQATEPKQKKSLLSGLLGGAKTIWVIAIALALLAVFGALTILGNAAATQTYYVLSRDVPARTLITPDMLVERQAKVNEAPPTAFDTADVQTGEVFTLIALQAGDVVTPSNAGPLARITEDIPDNFVAASFTAEPDLAVAGKVRKSDHIDLIVTSDNGVEPVSKIILQHVLVLDVTIAPTSIAEEAVAGQEGEAVNQAGPESEAVRSGIPTVYTVALSPKDATTLAAVRTLDIFVVLSANMPEEIMDISSGVNDVMGQPVTDSSAGTFDSIFIKRWNIAFNPGNVYVDDSGNFWQVNVDGRWVSGEVTASTPPEYTGEPADGEKFTDKDGKNWVFYAENTDTKEPAYWSTPATVLNAEDLPVGYLPVPLGTEFIDTDGVYWVTAPKDTKDDPLPRGETAPIVWYSPATKTELEPGDNPTGYNPNAEFSQHSDETQDTN